MKVYDFVMSKDRTVPRKLSYGGEKHIRRKFMWIAGLGLSTLVLIIIIVVVLCTVHTP
jgi:hypothetical protein